MRGWSDRLCVENFAEILLPPQRPSFQPSDRLCVENFLFLAVLYKANFKAWALTITLKALSLLNLHSPDQRLDFAK